MHTLNTGPHDNYDAAHEHAPFSPLDVGRRTGEEGAGKVSDGVYGVDDARGWRSFVEAEAKVGAILRVAVDCAHQTTVVTVDARIQRGDEQNEIKLGVVSFTSSHWRVQVLTLNMAGVHGDTAAFAVASAKATFWTCRTSLLPRRSAVVTPTTFCSTDMMACARNGTAALSQSMV